ncbi:MAG: hypothetical protein KGZ58_11315 [Ignavibacteriales bacterium]|nr:hypothetical protein [Ignavibacteriales bacterium]
MPTLAYIEGTTTIAMALVAVLRYNTLQKDMRILSVFFVLGVANQAAQLYLSFQGIQNLYLFHFYTLAEYILLMSVLSLWQKNEILKTILQYSIPIYTIVWLSAKMSLENPTLFDNFTSSLSSLIFIAVSAYTLLGVVDEAGENSVFRDPRFWILSAMLLYYSGGLVFFAMSNAILFYAKPEIIFAWSLHWGIGIMANLLYTSGYLCKPPR